MGWYKTGTVAVSNGSATVTGSGTAWVANARAGQAFALEGGAASYEIVAVVSDTEITIAPAYLGSTQAGQAYAIIPVVGFYRQAYDALSEAVAQWSDFVGSALAGLFKDGTSAAPGIAFEDETGTGLFRKAAGQLGFATGGIQRALLSSAAFKVDVPLTGTAVTQSAIDTTAGRIMKIGDFGTGTGGDTLTGDMDDVTLADGTYWVGSGTAGTKPFGHLYGLLQIAKRKTGDRVFQTYIFDQGRVYTRVNTSGTWTSWARHYRNDNILGTVSQTGGVPTGAVIERGSNANGEYVRFADGTQICTNDNAAVTTAPAAFVGTITKIDSDKLWLGFWF